MSAAVVVIIIVVVVIVEVLLVVVVVGNIFLWLINVYSCCSSLGKVICVYVSCISICGVALFWQQRMYFCVQTPLL
jgi:hypothetical protein